MARALFRVPAVDIAAEQSGGDFIADFIVGKDHGKEQPPAAEFLAGCEDIFPSGPAFCW